VETESNAYKVKLKKILLAQLILILVALAAFFYISSKAAEEMKEYRLILEKKEKAVEEYNRLKANIEKLYSVKVTPQNEVYEIKAAARATGGKASDGSPLYNFTIYINSPQELLNEIQKVTYDFDHPTFPNPHQESSNPATRFATGYIGWGCLRNVRIKVFLKKGTVHDIDFDMCKSIGWR